MVRRWLAATTEAPRIARVPPSRTERRSGVERRSLHERRQARPTGAVERIHEATDTLESRIAQLEEVLNGLDERSGHIEGFAQRLLRPAAGVDRASLAVA